MTLPKLAPVVTLAVALFAMAAPPGTAAGQLDPSAARSERAAVEALNAGIKAYLERRDAEAVAALERALSFSPRIAGARALLGRALRRGGDLHGAIRSQETLVAQSPADDDARDTLQRWRREAELHDRMELAVGDLFTVSFEGPAEAALAAEALAALDRAYWRITDLLGAHPLRSVPVILYSGEQFRDITRSPAWAAGAYDGRIRVPVRGALDNPKEFERVLAHEFTHALIHTLAPSGVPGWLNEGLATALESEDLTWAEQRIAAAGGAQSLAALQTSFGRLSGAQAQLAYASSAVAARRLVQEAGGAAVANLLRDLGDGVAFEVAFLHRVQRSFADFQASLPSP